MFEINKHKKLERKRQLLLQNDHTTQAKDYAVILFSDILIQVQHQKRLQTLVSLIYSIVYFTSATTAEEIN